MIDSGGFALATRPDSNWTVDAVAEAIARIDADIYVTLDLPPHVTDGPDERREKIVRSMENFSILLERFTNKTIMPVVHGRTMSEIELSLQLIGRHAVSPKWIGLGGVVPLLQRRRVSSEVKHIGPEQFIARAVSRINLEFPESLIHVFGAGGTRTIPAVCAFGAFSADTIGWRQAAGFGSIFLHSKSQRAVSWDREKRPPRKLLDESDLAQLELCQCPICERHSSIESRISALSANFYNRSIHNAWTITTQSNFFPLERTKMLSRIADGELGAAWANAANSAS